MAGGANFLGISAADFQLLLDALNRDPAEVAQVDGEIAGLREGIVASGEAKAPGDGLAKAQAEIEGASEDEGEHEGGGDDGETQALERFGAFVKSKGKASTQKRSRFIGAAFAFSKAISDGLEAGAQKMADVLADSLTEMAQQMTEKGFDMDRALKGLGHTLATTMLDAISQALIQQGVEKVTTGSGLVMKGKDGGGALMAEGAAMMAAGAMIKLGGAKFLAEGGLVSAPTLAFMGEGGQEEAVIPLDKLAGAEAFTDPARLDGAEMVFPGVRTLADLGSLSFRQRAARYFVLMQSRAVLPSAV